ncbi:glycosyltransferase family 4 protein [Aggregatilineales bacterium SYSU G02658]
MKNEPHQPLQVLFVSPFSDDRGGSERSLYSLIEHLPRERIAPEVLGQAPAEASVRERLQAHGVPLHEARFRTWYNIRTKRKGHLRLLRLLDNLRVARALAKTLPQYDLIYSNNTYSPLGALVAKFRRLPHIWDIRDHVALEGGSWQFDWPVGLSLSWADRNTSRFICHSQATFEKWAKYLSRSKMVLIDPGLVDETGLGQPRDPARCASSDIRLCIVGGVSEMKGQHEIIQALPSIVRAGLTPKLAIAGAADEPYKASLDALIDRLNVSALVTFLGYVNARQVFDSSDVHVMCTRSESAPRVAIESMARGCPTVATNIDGVREFIIDGVTGLLYPMGDPEALAQRIIELWNDPQRYEQFSQNGIELVRERFLISRYVERMVQIIEEVAHDTRRRSPLRRDGFRA